MSGGAGWAGCLIATALPGGAGGGLGWVTWPAGVLASPRSLPDSVMPPSHTQRGLGAVEAHGEAGCSYWF